MFQGAKIARFVQKKTCQVSCIQQADEQLVVYRSKFYSSLYILSGEYGLYGRPFFVPVRYTYSSSVALIIKAEPI